MIKAAVARVIVIVLLVAGISYADSAVHVRRARLELGAVLQNAPEAFRTIDLGPAPAPGGSVILMRDAIRHSVTEAGFDANLIAIPKTVRVVSEARRLSKKELGDLARPLVEQALPLGVTLREVSAKVAVTVSPEAVLGSLRLPMLPKRVGAFRSTLSLEFLHDGTSALRVPISIELEISEAATRPDVKRGAAISLVISKGAATVSADAVALDDNDIGSTARFRVLRTGRVIKARIISAQLALVAEALK